LIAKESPVKHIREQLQITQTHFASIAGVSKGYMSEVEAGIAALSEKMKEFLKELFIDVETVEKKHEFYMKCKQRQYREEAARGVQAEAEDCGKGG